MLFIFQTYSSLGQFKEAVIAFKDGTKIEGYAKRIRKQRIKFKEEPFGKAIKIDFDRCKYLGIYSYEGFVKYVQFPVKGKKHSRIIEEKIYGNMSLYTTTVSGTTSAPLNLGPSPVVLAPTTQYSIENFYLRRKNSDSVVHMGSNQLFSVKFYSTAANFFKDCPDLSNKIRSGEKGFRKKNIIEIVEYFNSHCN